MSAAASPCTGICTYDPHRGACLDCGRTLDEISAWPEADVAHRERIATAAAERRRDWDDPRG